MRELFTRIPKIPLLLITLTLLFVLTFPLVGHAQVATCNVTATAYKGDGSRAVGASLVVTKVVKTGVSVATGAIPVKADENGNISFNVLRGSTITLNGNVIIGGTDLTKGATYPIPDAASVTLESLSAVVTTPSAGLTLKINDSPQPNKIGTLDCGAGLNCTESPTGELNVAAIVTTDTLQAEADARAAADTAEANARAAADTTLQNNINSETSARQAADTSEAAARASADSSEAATRAAADSAEAAARGNADTALQAAVDTKAAASALAAHLADTGNPHAVTAAQVGALTQTQGDGRYSLSGHTHPNATATTPGFMSSTDKSKLDGIASGATANSPDSYLLSRANHTGSQPISTVTNLQSTLDLKVDSTDPRLSDARTPIAHASSHAAGGTDPVAISESQVANLVSDLAGKAASVHTHTLAQVLDAGTAASRNVPATGNASTTQVVLGSDTRLTDARTPTAHAASHAAGGSDPISISESQVSNLPSDLAAKAPTSRTIGAGTGLSGGGDLSADRSLSVVPDSTNQQVRVSRNGTLTGTRREINLVEGANTTITAVDDAVNNRVSVTVASSNPGGTVTNFSATTPQVFYDVSVSNPTTTPNLTLILRTQTANCVFAGPSSGLAAQPSCRLLIPADIPDLSGTYATLSTAQTLGNKTLNSPKIGTGLYDANGNTMVAYSPTASAVNYFSMTNAAATGNPILGVAGNDTNISLQLQPKGTGVVKIVGASYQLQLSDTGVQMAQAAGTLPANAFTYAGNNLTQAMSVWRWGSNAVRPAISSNSTTGKPFIGDTESFQNGFGMAATNVVALYTYNGTSATERVRIDGLGNVVIGTAALSTSATDGYLYGPSTAGAPTGTPTTYTGRVPWVVDTSNSKVCFYIGGAWKCATLN